MSDRDVTPGGGDPDAPHPSGLPNAPRDDAPRPWATPTPPESSGQPGADAGYNAPPVPPGYDTGYNAPPVPSGYAAAPRAELGVTGGQQLVLSGWWRRVGAQVIDGFVISALFVVICLIFGVGASSLDGGSDASTAAAVGAFLLVLVIYVVAAALYAPLLMAKTNGQTLGRMATGIRVVRTSGRPMTFGAAMLREVAVKWLLFGGVGFGFTGGIATLLDYLWPLWDEENRALHDFVAQTRVVRA